MGETGKRPTAGRLLLVTDRHPVPGACVDAVELQRLSWQIEVCRPDACDDPANLRLIAATRRVLAKTPASVRPVVLLVGREGVQRRWVLALAAAGIKARVRVALHVRASRVPLDSRLVDLFRLADLIVTDSEFGGRAVLQCCRDGGRESGGPIVTIPPAPPRELPNLRAGRDAARRSMFDVGRDQLLIGATADATATAVLAMDIFRVFADGSYRACDRCGRITPFPSDLARPAPPVAACEACGSTDGRPGHPRPEARLFLAGRDVGAQPGEPLGTWTASDARRLLGLEGRVFLDGDPGMAPRASFDALVRDLALADIYLAPHPLADVEPALLASCALGVPTVATRFGAAAEQLVGMTRLVQPAVTLDTSEGHREALMDVGGAVRELLDLADDPRARLAEGARARLAMASLTPSAVAARWHDHLARLTGG